MLGRVAASMSPPLLLLEEISSIEGFRSCSGGSAASKVATLHWGGRQRRVSPPMLGEIGGGGWSPPLLREVVCIEDRRPFSGRSAASEVAALARGSKRHRRSPPVLEEISGIECRRPCSERSAASEVAAALAQGGRPRRVSPPLLGEPTASILPKHDRGVRQLRVVAALARGGRPRRVSPPLLGGVGCIGGRRPCSR